MLKSIIPDIPDIARRRVLLSIIAVIAVYGLTTGLVYPLISLNMEERGFSGTMIGLMGMMPFISTVLVSPFVPIVMRSMNITMLVAICIALDLIFLASLAFNDSIAVWFAIRFLMGVAGSGLYIASETWINEIAEERYRGRVVGIYTFTLSLTFAAGPLFIVALGTQGYLPFLIPAAIMGVCFIPLWFTRYSRPNFSEGRVSQVFGFVWLAPVLVAAAAMVSFEEATMVTLLPVYAVRNGLSAEYAAFLLTVVAAGSMIAQPLIGWLADNVNRVSIMSGCAVATVIGATLLPMTISSNVLTFIVLLLWGGGLAGTYTIALTLMGQRFRGGQLAAGNAMFGFMWGFAGGAGPAIAGPVMDVWDPHGFIAVMLAMAVAFLLVVIARSRSANQHC